MNMSNTMSFDDIWASIPKRARYNIFDDKGRSLGDVFATSEENAVERGRELGFASVKATR